jgi:hypothetical protein
MEKVNSKFLFKTEYEDLAGKYQQATVVLEIDYKAKTYSITPSCGSVNDGFKFIQTSHKWAMWKAILKSIDDAIDFANGELGFVNVK